MTDLRSQLTRSCAAEGMAARAVAYDPDARAFEVFSFSEFSTELREPLEAATLNDALAEVTSRWSWDRGDRLGVREIGGKVDQLHVYAVRQKSQGHHVWRDHMRSTEYRRWLDHICTIDLNIIHGIDVVGVGVERVLFERRQAQRPEGARL
jgi:hypothetical protein